MRYVKDLRLSSMLKNRLEVWGTETAKEKNKLGQHHKQEKKQFEVYGAILPQTGGLLNNRPADTVLTRTTHKIVCRYNKNITSANWFMYNGVRYDILFLVNPYLNNERLEIYVEAVI